VPDQLEAAYAERRQCGGDVLGVGRDERL
jgi:hypothetical protein